MQSYRLPDNPKAYWLRCQDGQLSLEEEKGNAKTTNEMQNTVNTGEEIC